MLFPELTERLMRLLHIKHFEPGHAIDLDRPLTAEEHELVKQLLVRSGGDAAGFVRQLEDARVSGQCSCGCPSVYFRVPAHVGPVERQERVLSDFVGTVKGNLVGVLMHQSGGYLCELEVYDLSDIQRPYGLPDASTLRPFADEVPTATPN